MEAGGPTGQYQIYVQSDEAALDSLHRAAFYSLKL